MKSSTMTGIAAVLLAAGFAALIAALFRGGGPLLWIALALLAATIVCWFMAARAQGASG